LFASTGVFSCYHEALFTAPTIAGMAGIPYQFDRGNPVVPGACL